MKGYLARRVAVVTGVTRASARAMRVIALLLSAVALSGTNTPVAGQSGDPLPSLILTGPQEPPRARDVFELNLTVNSLSNDLPAENATVLLLRLNHRETGEPTSESDPNGMWVVIGTPARLGADGTARFTDAAAAAGLILYRAVGDDTRLFSTTVPVEVTE